MHVYVYAYETSTPPTPHLHNNTRNIHSTCSLCMHCIINCNDRLCNLSTSLVIHLYSDPSRTECVHFLFSRCFCHPLCRILPRCSERTSVYGRLHDLRLYSAPVQTVWLTPYFRPRPYVRAYVLALTIRMSLPVVSTSIDIRCCVKIRRTSTLPTQILQAPFFFLYSYTHSARHTHLSNTSLSASLRWPCMWTSSPRLCTSCLSTLCEL